MYPFLWSSHQDSRHSHITYARLLRMTQLILVCMTVLLWRLVQVAWWRQSIESSGQALQTLAAPLRRDIVDRNGILLATHVKTYSLYADPKKISDPHQVATKLVKIFPHLHFQTIYQRLTTPRHFVWLTRHLTPGQAQMIFNLGIPGLDVMPDAKRLYPYGPLFSHVLGLTDIDSKGVAGLEKAWEAHLSRSPYHEPVVTSLDVRCQHILREELNRAITTFQAKGANGMLIHLPTGQIYAMVSLPDYNPHNLHEAQGPALFNRNTSGVYEMGSILKIHNTALALERGNIKLGSLYDNSLPLAIGRFRVTDFRPKLRGFLNVVQAFIYSSNIAQAKMVLEVGTQQQQRFLGDLGLLQSLRFSLPEVASPLLPSYWSTATTLTVSYGYGAAWAPLHVAQSLVGLFHKKLIPLTLEKSTAPPQGRQVISEKTHQTLCALMRANVLSGQGTKGAVEGYDIGGKTGTANQQSGKRGYQQKKNLTTFVMIYPSRNPQWLLMVQIDCPQATHLTHGYATAGWTAAPTAAAIFQRLAPVMGWAPQERTTLIPASLQRYILP